ncbi:flavin-containing monooxygenase [Rhodospirillaceae bacterium SYSU D60014]|uniref:NAD(P)-binding domain-containing protein n=1 Tax=Virgifigura deserti TaxID=2268457 RepID=UPI000E6620F8
MTQRVAIIGAGPSGLSQLRAFQQARAKGAEIPEIVCFEKQNDWGGLWHYTWRTGLDAHGEAVHSSMYRYLWSNGPKECLEYGDYSFDQHFGRPIPSFPPREVLHNYITTRAKVSGIRDWVRFETAVRWVGFDEAERRFTVVSEDLPTRRVTRETFDSVIVASGHYSVPNAPSFPGIEQFPGRVLHAHDFRNAMEFAGRDILIVGASYSAEDIGLQCHKYGARSVTMSYRTKAMGFTWPESMEERPLLTRIDGSTVHFGDGSHRDVDAIILCTGYLHRFPFLAEDLKLHTHNRLYPPGLYKGVVWEANPQLLFVGMQDQFYTFSMFDLQAWTARDVVMGRISLPDTNRMAAHSARWVEREEALVGPEQQIDFQTDYCKELAAAVDYPAIDFDLVAANFKEWEHEKVRDITGYRNTAYRSAVTGTMASIHHTTWLEATDDSMKTFLGDGERRSVQLPTRSVAAAARL